MTSKPGPILAEEHGTRIVNDIPAREEGADHCRWAGFGSYSLPSASFDSIDTDLKNATQGISSTIHSSETHEAVKLQRCSSADVYVIQAVFARMRRAKR
jgi:hypothetical protein